MTTTLEPTPPPAGSGVPGTPPGLRPDPGARSDGRAAPDPGAALTPAGEADLLRLRPVGIRAIGAYLPERVVTNTELAERLPTDPEWIERRIGVRTRRFAAPDEWASDLGARALLDACEQDGLDPQDLDLVICATYTPDHMLPSTACAILATLGVDGVPCFDVNSGGCPGSVFALDVGAKFVRAGYRRVAVVLTDVSSKLFDPEDRTVGVIFGDGAACYLLGPTAGEGSVGDALLRSRPSGYRSAYAQRGPRTTSGGDVKLSGFGENFTVMVGRDIWDFVEGTVPDFVREFLAGRGLVPDDIDFFALHQANVNLVHLVMDRLGQPMSKTLVNVGRVGNTSAASVPLVLREAAATGQLRPGDLALLVAFGGGLSYAATLVRWGEPGRWSDV